MCIVCSQCFICSSAADTLLYRVKFSGTSILCTVLLTPVPPPPFTALTSLSQPFFLSPLLPTLPPPKKKQKKFSLLQRHVNYGVGEIFVWSFSFYNHITFQTPFTGLVFIIIINYCVWTSSAIFDHVNNMLCVEYIKYIYLCITFMNFNVLFIFLWVRVEFPVSWLMM